MNIVRGIEYEIGRIRRSPRRLRTVTIPLNSAERGFLLHRIAAVSETAESILHNPPPGQHLGTHTRQQIVGRVLVLRDVLRDPRKTLVVSSLLDRTIIANAIEKNGYFAGMATGDPRLCIDAVRQANALRVRVAGLLGRPIARIPLGAGREKLPQ